MFFGTILQSFSQHDHRQPQNQNIVKNNKLPLDGRSTGGLLPKLIEKASILTTLDLRNLFSEASYWRKPRKEMLH